MHSFKHNAYCDAIVIGSAGFHNVVNPNCGALHYAEEYAEEYGAQCEALNGLTAESIEECFLFFVLVVLVAHCLLSTF